MTDPEELEAKNEQELNLFPDQPGPGETSRVPENGDPAVPGETLPAGMFAPDDSAGDGAEPDAEAAGEPEPEAGAQQDDDAPVVAPPPPPRKHVAPVRPGIVVPPRSGRAVRQSSSVSSSSAYVHKPLPHPLQPDQTLGQMLAFVRNARGLSVEDVANATLIRAEYIVELETGDLYQRLSAVYVSSYVRKLIEEVYDLSKADRDILIEKMKDEMPLDPEALPPISFNSRLGEIVKNGTQVNEAERKRIRNYTIVIYVIIGLVAIALVWLVVLVIVKYVSPRSPAVPARAPAAMSSDPGTVPSAEEPVAQTVHLDESELDALIVPETPSISVLKMSKVPGVRESL